MRIYLYNGLALLFQCSRKTSLYTINRLTWQRGALTSRMHSLTSGDCQFFVIARSETTKQSRQLKAEIATLRSQ